VVSSYPERVYEIVLTVPPGRVITYGAIARLLGDPRKAREVGWAMAATPDRQPPIPAHRVINARGEISGNDALGGSAVRRALLRAEGVDFLSDGRVDLDRYFWLPPITPARRLGVQQAVAK
jgi:methylated-DNA-protein-cysteine methyltransferase-like protein